MNEDYLRQLVWPKVGTAAELAGLLAEAANAATNANNGGGSFLVERYLQWGAGQVRMLRDRLEEPDLNRLVTTATYRAVFANSSPGSISTAAISDELTSQARALEQAAAALQRAEKVWKLRHGSRFSSLAVVDTNFWIERSERFADVDWHALIPDRGDTDGHDRTSQLRLVVPILVVDELDALAHRGDTKTKARGAARWIYQQFAERPDEPATITRGAEGIGHVTGQLLFDPRGHTRLPIADDELVARTTTLAAFLGIATWRTYFITYDAGAAFRASAAGITPSLQRRA